MLLLITPSECFGQAVSGSTYTVTGANGVLTAGPASPTTGSAAQVDWDWKQGSTDISVMGGFFNDKVYIGQGWSRTFTSADTGSGNAGSAATWSLAVNNGSPQQITGNMAWAWAKTSNSIVFGSNIVATTDQNLSNVQATGLEIDVQPGSGTSLNGSSAGLIVNNWTVANPSSAISINVDGGGTWAVGLQCNPGSVVEGCVIFPNGAAGGAIFKGTGQNSASIYNSSDYLIANEGTSGLAIKAQNGFSNHLVLSNSGALQLSQYGRGVLTTDASGNVTAGNAPSFIGGNNGAIAIPAGTTTYMLNCANATFGLCAAVAPLDATAKNLFVVTNAAPGTGQQYTITFATNISSTVLSCTISGAATSCSDKIHNANIVAGQQYTVKFTSSAGAAPVNITWGAELDTH
jgi:hypothetical protein